MPLDHFMNQAKFALEALDACGEALDVGMKVRVMSVDSCAQGLPDEDQLRLREVVGQVRSIVEFDRTGFVWLSFVEPPTGADFCVFPKEVALV